MRFRDRVVIVTGATSGIGRATAERFVSEGARVALLGIDDELGRAVEMELNTAWEAENTDRACYLRCDVSRAEEVSRAVADVVGRWGRLSVLVNNAAVMTFNEVEALSEADWDRVMAVNLRGPFLLSKYCLPHFVEGAALVNVSSVHAVASGAGVSPYAASKGGLEALTRALALECDARKIRVNAVRPGSVDTPMLWQNPSVKAGREKVDSVELGKPSQVAAAIAYLASDDASFITGAVLSVDGGRLAHLGGHSG